MRAIFISKTKLPGVFRIREDRTASYEAATTLRDFPFMGVDMEKKRDEKMIAVCRKGKHDELDTSEVYCMECFEDMGPLDLAHYYGATKTDLEPKVVKCTKCEKILALDTRVRFEMFWEK